MTKKFYMETKSNTLESAILDVWKNAAENNMSGEQSYEVGTDRYRKHTQDLTPGQQAENYVAETNKNDKSDDGDGLDAVQPKAVKKKFDDRKDKDIDNDGDTDDSDEFMHKKRKAISKAIDKKENVKEGVSNLRDTIINMWTEASSAVNPKEREELDMAPEKTAKKMKRAAEPSPMVATEEVDLGEGKYMMSKEIAKDMLAVKSDVIKRLPTIKQLDYSKEELQKLLKKHKDLDRVLSKSAMNKGVALDRNKLVNITMGKGGEFRNEEVDLDEAKKTEKDEGNAFGKALMAAKEKGEKTFVVAGKKYDVQEELSLESAQQFKVASMKEALAKVWGLDEKKTDETYMTAHKKKKDEAVKKGGKTETGGEVAEVEIDPKLKDK